jgi:hypothetical protein
VRACLRIAEDIGLPVVVSSAIETSVGIAAGVALAASLPELHHACGLATVQLLAGDVTDAPEVQLRIGVRGDDRPSVERFTREIAPLVLNGPPSVTGFAGGRPKVEEVVAYWPALVDKSVVTTKVSME